MGRYGTTPATQGLLRNIATQSQSGGSGTSIPNKLNSPPNRPVRWTFSMVFATTGVVQSMPGFRVPAGCSVWLYAKNGASGGNIKPCFVGSYPAELANGGGTALQPNDEMPWPSENVAGLWAQGTAGDGLIAQVITNPAAGS